MNPHRVGAGSATAGVAVIATCLCSTAKFTLGGIALGGAVIALNLHAAMLTIAAGLVLAGLSSRSPAAGFRGLLGFALLAGGYLLAPPAVMTRDVAHTTGNLLGFGLTLAGIAGLVWAFLSAYPTNRPRPAAFAAGGFGAAAGCSCCMATGAATWLGAAAGLSIPAAPFADGIPFVLFMGIGIVALYHLAGPRPALLALTGAVLAFGGDEALKPLLADDIERVPRLLATLAGMLLTAGAFASAFAAARPGLPAGEMKKAVPNISAT